MVPTIGSEWVEDVEERAKKVLAVPLINVYLALGGSPDVIRANNHIKVHCLQHVDATPSMALYDDGHFHAYCCSGGHGDVIKFVQWNKKSNYIDSIAFIESVKLEKPHLEYISLKGRRRKGVSDDGRLCDEVTKNIYYDYEDEDGRPYIRVVRTETYRVDKAVDVPNIYGIQGEILSYTKTFSQLHAHQGDGDRCIVCGLCHINNEWLAGTTIIAEKNLPENSSLRARRESMEPIPLGALEFLRRAKNGEVAFFLEGEKAANAMRAEGFFATCVHGGTNMRLRERSLRILSQAPGVVIVPDFDKSGILGAQKWLKDMTAYGIKAVMDVNAYARIDPYLKELGLKVQEKDDFADFIAEYKMRNLDIDLREVLSDVFPYDKIYGYFGIPIPDSVGVDSPTDIEEPIDKHVVVEDVCSLGGL